MLNPNIILAGQSPDILNALANSNVAAQQRVEFDRTNAMNRMLQEQGAGIIAGDQNALNALAGYDPMAALGVQDARLGMDATRLGMDATRQQMEVLDIETKRAAEEYARGLSKEQAAAEAAQLEAGVKQALMAPNAAAFDALMTQMGRPELVGQFENRQMLAGQFMSVAEILKMTAPPDPTTSQRDYQFYADQETAAGRQPLSFNDWDLQSKKAAAATTTVNTTVTPAGGDSSTRPGQVFDEMKLSAENARSAVTGLRALREAEKALEGGAITGFAADARLGAAKLGALLGVTDPEVIANTETFRAAIAPQVAAMIKATVGSAQLSNADREFAEKAAGGNISLDETTIARLLDIMTRASEASVESHMRRLDAVYPPGSGADRERALFTVNNPNGPQDDGTGIGTIEDGYRYIGGDSSKPEAWEKVE